MAQVVHAGPNFGTTINTISNNITKLYEEDTSLESIRRMALVIATVGTLACSFFGALPYTLAIAASIIVCGATIADFGEMPELLAFSLLSGLLLIGAEEFPWEVDDILYAIMLPALMIATVRGALCPQQTVIIQQQNP
ncbi:MAG: hypothetical protein S4CHLAM102_16110 [Chlamydiia bacterium]|nr:hypothetical protein [Chlamydiia bacterium]